MAGFDPARRWLVAGGGRQDGARADLMVVVVVVDAGEWRVVKGFQEASPAGGVSQVEL